MAALRCCPPEPSRAEGAMFLDCTPEQHQLRREPRAYIAVLMTPELSEAVGGRDADRAACRHLVRRLGRDWWLGLGWPSRYGGHWRAVVDQYILVG